MLLRPLKSPVPLPTAARGRALVGRLEEFPDAEPLDQTWRPFRLCLRATRSRFEESSEDPTYFTALHLNIEHWVKRRAGAAPLPRREEKVG